MYCLSTSPSKPIKKYQVSYRSLSKYNGRISDYNSLTTDRLRSQHCTQLTFGPDNTSAAAVSSSHSRTSYHFRDFLKVSSLKVTLPMVKDPYLHNMPWSCWGSDEVDDQGPAVLFYGLCRLTLTSSLASVGSTSKSSGFPKFRLVVR